MAQIRTAELRRRAEHEQLLASARASKRRLVPVMIRYGDSLDASALLALAALDSAEPLTLPVLVADVEGELRAALSLVDARVIADPFRPTSELVELLHTRAQQLAAEPHSGLRARLRAAMRAARTLRLELRRTGSGSR